MAREFKQIVVIGAGELGQAVRKLLGNKNAAPAFWDADPARVPGQKPLAELIPPADLVLLCVPSWAVRDAVAEISPLLHSGTVAVSFSKGLDEKSLKTMGELLPEILPQDGHGAPQPFAVIGGPMLAGEIMKGEPAAGIIGSPNRAVCEDLAALFTSDHFKVETCADAFSVSLAGVLKNIYAVALGIADGLGYDGNQKGWLAGRAMEEMVAVAKALGANTQIITGTAGFADFLATAYSPYSRNREVGEEIVKNGKCNLKGEGLVSLPLLEQRLKTGNTLEVAIFFPFLTLIKKTAINCEPAKPAFEAFFNSLIP